jgi:hypothetical protein
VAISPLTRPLIREQHNKSKRKPQLRFGEAGAIDDSRC